MDTAEPSGWRGSTGSDPRYRKKRMVSSIITEGYYSTFIRYLVVHLRPPGISTVSLGVLSRLVSSSIKRKNGRGRVSLLNPRNLALPTSDRLPTAFTLGQQPMYPGLGQPFNSFGVQRDN